MLGLFVKGICKISDFGFQIDPMAQRATKSEKFDETIVEAARKAKIVGVRAGTEHRYTGVWVVVVEGRVLVRSWNDKPTGWFRAFRSQPTGMLQLATLELPVRGKTVRSSRIRDAVTKAYGEKYNTKASQKWVKGFAEAERLVNTLEFVPR
jgi:hypothetical protein